MKVITNNPYFYALVLLMIVAGGIALPFVEKGELVLWVNARHSPVLDVFFKYTTELGNGLLFVVIVLILLLVRFKYAVAGALSFGITGGLVQFLKRQVFTDWHRPVKYLEGMELHTVDGVKVMHHFSFPSGHSATVFAMFTLLTIIITNKKLGIPAFMLAALGALSRVYLVQHFYVDIYVGSITGVVITTVIFIVFSRTRWYQHSVFANKPLLNVRRSK